jgi:HAD superfamily hydrolase (TIGR01509 family)
MIRDAMAPRELDAVIFDQDGVLIDSEARWDAARRAIAAESGGHWHQDATTAMIGMSAPEWSRYMHEQLGVPLAPDEINQRVVARLLEGYEHDVPLVPGAVEAVRRLAKRWRLGLASSANRPVIDRVLELAGIAECFSATVSSEEVAAGKPSPDVYLEAATRLNVDPSRAAAIEDSGNGLRAAAAAGMLVIALPNREFPPGAAALELADLVIDSLDELTPAAILAAG